ncbi:hypothetical protein [Acidiphilium iwatense]|uniref:Uncharacterized protein n=1 Tax=Acidiphilium iwatense TaxID=768198 RepID=A0ABS9DWX8_9PROT|nr:hypothetical protein [Acidiphilium iwatense]MCF3947235.1 hypothetical protein [Acidiphilium iwatense]
MAKLVTELNSASDRVQRCLSLEITYRTFEFGWVFYNIFPSFDDQPILNDAVLKNSADRGGTKPGSLHANEDEFCSLLPDMRRFLENGETVFWMPVEADVALEIKRWSFGDIEPFDPSRADQDQSNVELILDIDHYQFRDVTAYGGGMIKIVYLCSWTALRQFYRDLRAEFLTFRDANDITAYNVTRGFDRPEHDWF